MAAFICILFQTTFYLAKMKTFAKRIFPLYCLLLKYSNGFNIPFHVDTRALGLWDSHPTTESVWYRTVSGLRIVRFNRIESGLTCLQTNDKGSHTCPLSSAKRCYTYL